MYVLTLKNGHRYTLANDGAVLSRTDTDYRGDYSGRWIVLGFATRFHSQRIISLAEAANGADIGHGWIHDLDHGTHRMWGGPTGRRAARIEAVS